MGLNSRSRNTSLASARSPTPADCRRANDRRQRSTPMISRYLFVGRRWANRRQSDPQTEYYVDRPHKWLIVLVLFVVLLGTLDALFTFKLLIEGGTEMIPLINFYLDIGWGYCMFFKFVLTIVGLLVLLLHQNFFRMRRVIISMGIFYALLTAYQAFLLLTI